MQHAALLSDNVELSKALNKLLRHDATKENLEVFENGFIEITDAFA